MGGGRPLLFSFLFAARRGKKKRKRERRRRGDGDDGASANERDDDRADVDERVLGEDVFIRVRMCSIPCSILFFPPSRREDAKTRPREAQLGRVPRALVTSTWRPCRAEECRDEAFFTVSENLRGIRRVAASFSRARGRSVVARASFIRFRSLWRTRAAPAPSSAAPRCPPCFSPRRF